ncbi:phosphoribosylanthranilate isomerase [Alphaproteobacteria bacterium GH1-50]|uniref:N-(5'-phosphoribosyl)anthranilate isomerase n=1 Tax=Kangsaoukella pontilimi TaxID=2691042 RepID=A0A7C9N272_9RHOB|nr:phosphoribosylanthranilate isomerase [Kangsaoukella pontilimi]MXQ09178.1 phosphoribosylanthranilate isomerase [Kangsaoukella pontilimi]
MRPTVRTKICGLKTPQTVAAAVSAGAAYVGFNFVPKSPRYAAPELARTLALDVPEGVAKVGLVVDQDDAALDALLEVVPLDFLQLHGSEAPERVSEVRARYGLPVIKAVGLRDAEDLPAIAAFEAVADQVLVDAKPPRGATLEGGNGVTFDWRLIAGRKWSKPWMLAGGLTVENVAQAVSLTGARQVDLSSGVETAPGVKDAALIRAFLAAVP